MKTNYKFTVIDGQRHRHHRLVYEAHYGPIPEGHDVHHLDGDKGNNAPTNLVVLDHAEQARLHAHERRHALRKKAKTQPRDDAGRFTLAA
jgi:HNH endonuclease